MRFFIYLSYDGANYHGWQIQPNGNSVQAELNRAVTILLHKETEVTGAGRTDTGVNASMMVAHFDAESLPDIDVKDKLNRILPQDISVHKIVEVNESAHARFSAKARTYKYFIHTDRNPFDRKYSSHITYPLDFEKMNMAAELLFNYTDFTSFSKLHTDTKTNDCKIMYAKWEKTTGMPSLGKYPESDSYVFTIKADRFLRNMVRAIVGTLLDVGRGMISLDEFKKIIEKKDRCSAGMSVPGNALFLTDIDYPEELFQL